MIKLTIHTIIYMYIYAYLLFIWTSLILAEIPQKDKDHLAKTSIPDIRSLFNSCPKQCNGVWWGISFCIWIFLLLVGKINTYWPVEAGR